MNDIIGASLTKKQLNLVEFVGLNPHKTISEIAKELNLDYGNAHRCCRILHKKGFFLLTPLPEKSRKGAPVKVSLNFHRNDEDAEYILLNLLKQNGGRIEEKKLIRSLDEYQNLLSDDFGKEKTILLISLLYGNPHIKREIVISEEGKDFLKENSKRKELKEKIKSLNSRKNK
jgi:DNA-binding MarR family transcriptional regulator